MEILHVAQDCVGQLGRLEKASDLPSQGLMQFVSILCGELVTAKCSECLLFVHVCTATSNAELGVGCVFELNTRDKTGAGRLSY